MHNGRGNFMALNLSREVTKIKMRMGIYGISIPIDDPDNYIREIIETVTIPTFSQYQPYYDYLYCKTDDLRKAPEYDNKTSDSSAYLLPEFKNRRLIAVVDVAYADTGVISYDGVAGYAISGILPYSNSSLLQQAALTNVTSHLYQTMYPRMTFDYIEPNTLIIYNKIVSNSLKIMLAFEHHKSLATIPYTAEQSFFDLALLDCETQFYQLAKHWDNIETAIGNINLKIEDWQDAESRRTDLLNQWADVYHLDVPYSIIYK